MLPKSPHIVGGSYEGAFQLWDSHTTEAIFRLQILDKGTSGYIGSQGLLLFAHRELVFLFADILLLPPGSHIAASNSGELFATAGKNGRVRVWK